MRNYIRRAALLVLFLAPAAYSYVDGTVLQLDVSKNRIIVNNSGSVGGSQVVTCDSNASEVCEIRFYMGGDYVYVTGSNTLCHDPCSVSLNTEYGRMSYLMVVKDATDTTTLRTSSRQYLAFTPHAAASAPWPVPTPVHGFKDYTKYFTFTLPATSDFGLRVWIWGFNFRQNTEAVITNAGTEHVLSTTPMVNLTSSGGTCTGTTLVPHGLHSGDQVQLNGFNVYTQGIGGSAQFNGQLFTLTSVMTPTTFTFTTGCPATNSAVWIANTVTTNNLQYAGASVSKTTIYTGEEKYYGGLDGLHNAIRMTAPVGSSEFTLGATNTLGLRFKDILDASTHGLTHGGYWRFEILDGPDLQINSITVSGTTATATTNGTIPAPFWHTGDTVIINNAPGPQWRFNDLRVITLIDSTHFSFPWGPDVVNLGEPGEAAGTAPFTTPNGVYTVPSVNLAALGGLNALTNAPQPVMTASHCLIPKSSFTGPTLPGLGGDPVNGKNVFTNTILRDPNSAIPGNLSKGSCQTSLCHTNSVATVSDLKYNGFPEYVSVVGCLRRAGGAAQLSGDQEKDCKDLAAFITSNSVQRPNKGRPYNPPFQPAPGLDAQDASTWAAGGGLEWRLTYDNDMCEYMIPGAFPPECAGGTYAAWAATSAIKLREIPLVYDLPHWMQWLPRMSPVDFFYYFNGATDFNAYQLGADYTNYLAAWTPVTLTGAITNSQTSLPVTDASKIVNNDYLQLASGEYVKVTAGGGTSGATTLTVTRNQAPCATCTAAGASSQASGSPAADFTTYINLKDHSNFNFYATLDANTYRLTYDPANAGAFYDPGMYGNPYFDIFPWNVGRLWELAQTFSLFNMGNSRTNAANALAPNARASAQVPRSLFSHTFSVGPHISAKNGQFTFFNQGSYNELIWNRFTAGWYLLSAVLDNGNRFHVNLQQQDDGYYVVFNNEVGRVRPAEWLHWMGQAWEAQNSWGWPIPWTSISNNMTLNISLAAGGSGALGYSVKYGADLFTSEARRTELTATYAQMLNSNLGTFSAAQWQDWLRVNPNGYGCATEFTHTPSRVAGRSGSACFSDQLAFGLAVMHFYSVSPTTLTSLVTQLNAIYAATGYDFTADSTATCSYTAPSTGAAVGLNCP